MQNNFLSILPPFVILILAFKTKKVLNSIFWGILTACLIFKDFNPIETLKVLVIKTWQTTELSSLASWQDFSNNFAIFLFLFLIFLGIIITLISHTGGAFAYANFINKKIKDIRAAQSSSLILSLLFFMDDSFSIITVGSVMSTVTDKFKLAKAKLAFLVNSMGPTFAILVPISSWGAYIVMQLQKSGVQTGVSGLTYLSVDPFIFYIKTIPFIFYPILIIFSAWFIVRFNISFGLMKKHETIALETGNLYAGKEEINKKLKEAHEDKKQDSNMLDFLIPISSLIILAILSILFFGNYYFLGGNNNLIEAFKSSKSTKALCLGSLISLLITIIFYLIRKRLTFKEIPLNLKEGFNLMKNTILTLILAWTFGSLLKDDLLTGKYLADILLGHLPVIFLPTMFFGATLATSIMMGTAWGTMAVIIPIGIPMIVSFVGLSPNNGLDLSQISSLYPIIFPTLGAILAGSVCGNHFSPIADATVLSAASTGAYHIDHVRTLHTYSVPTMFVTGFTFLISGLLTLTGLSLYLNALISFLVGFIVNITYLEVRNKLG